MRIRRAKPEEVRYACKNFHYTHLKREFANLSQPYPKKTEDD